ncbi:hypothetical protein J6590_066015 [Homalodisca vitripennis]|nr:hypothetical protein J6590_066015 [Homalodisca vitripennis]
MMWHCAKYTSATRSTTVFSLTPGRDCLLVETIQECRQPQVCLHFPLRRVGAKSAEGGLDPEAARLAHSISVVVQGRSGACQKRVADTDGGGPAITRAPRSRVFICGEIPFLLQLIKNKHAQPGTYYPTKLRRNLLCWKRLIVFHTDTKLTFTRSTPMQHSHTRVRYPIWYEERTKQKHNESY